MNYVLEQKVYPHKYVAAAVIRLGKKILIFILHIAYMSYIKWNKYNHYIMLILFILK